MALKFSVHMGYTQSVDFKNQQVSLVLSAVSWDHNYCRIFTKQTECPSRLGILEFQGSLRLETPSKYVQKHNQTFWISNRGPFCIKAVPSTSTIRSMEARSKKHSNRCNVAVLEQNVSICFPPFQSYKSNSEKGLSRKGRTNDNNNTNMANTTLVSSSVRDFNVMSTAVGTIARSTVRSSRKQTPFSSKQEINANDLEGCRKSLEMERPGSIISYKLAWNKQTSWCVRAKLDPFCALLSKIVNYLSTLFNEGIQYQTVNAHRSAISAYHNFINGKPIEKHPKVCALLTGIFNERPPQPRYSFIWNVDVVLTYIKNNMSVNYKLFEKNLTYKLTVLFALSSALRASSIQHLSIKFMAKAKSYYRFSFKNGWRKGKAPLPVAFQEYAQDETLSVDYGGIYSQTERWRSGEEHSQFLLSFLHPYKPVISSTTSGWLKLSS